MIKKAINDKCKGSMKEPNISENHGTIEPVQKEGIKCLLGGSDVKFTMLRDFGGNQVWFRISNDIFDSEDVLPVAEEKPEDSFQKRLEDIIGKYHQSIETIQNSKNQTQTVVEAEDIIKSIQKVFKGKDIKCDSNNVCKRGEKQTVAIFKLEEETWIIHFY